MLSNGSIPVVQIITQLLVRQQIDPILRLQCKTDNPVYNTTMEWNDREESGCDL